MIEFGEDDHDDLAGRELQCGVLEHQRGAYADALRVDRTWRRKRRACNNVRQSAVMFITFSIAFIQPTLGDLPHSGLLKADDIILMMSRPRVRATALSAQSLQVDSHALCGAIGMVFCVMFAAASIQDLLQITGLSARSHWLLDVGAEQNVFRWGQTLLLGLNAALIWALSAADHKQRFAWIGFSLVLFALSLSELADVRLALMPLWRMHPGDLQSPPFLAFASALLLLATIYARLLLSLPTKERSQIAIAATLYLIGYLGFRSLAEEASAIFEPTSLWRRLPIFLAEGFSVVGQLILLGAALNLLAARRIELLPDADPVWSSPR